MVWRQVAREADEAGMDVLQPGPGSESLAMSPLPLTPSFTRVIGSTLDVVGVGDNRIGTV